MVSKEEPSRWTRGHVSALLMLPVQAEAAPHAVGITPRRQPQVRRCMAVLATLHMPFYVREAEQGHAKVC